MQRNHVENWKDMLSVDFSAESEKKDEIKQALLQQIHQQDAVMRGNQTEDSTMNQTNKKRFKLSSVIALAACMTVVLSITAFAAVNYFNLGQYANYISDPIDAGEEDAMMEEEIPAELKGLLFDKDGNMVEKYGDMLEGIYNADGEAVMIVNDVVMTQEELNMEHTQATTLFSTLEEAQPYLAFDALPFTYVPDGYVLEGYRVYNDENGEPAQDTKYLEMNFYKNGDTGDRIYVQVRLMDEETAYTTGGSQIEKTTINGYEAVLGNSDIDILIDDVMYMIIGNNLPQSEIVKMAEALTQ